MEIIYIICILFVVFVAGLFTSDLRERIRYMRRNFRTYSPEESAMIRGTLDKMKKEGKP